MTFAICFFGEEHIAKVFLFKIRYPHAFRNSHPQGRRASVETRPRQHHAAKETRVAVLEEEQYLQVKRL